MYLVMFELNFKLGYYWSVLELAYMASICPSNFPIYNISYKIPEKSQDQGSSESY